jgi:hypothetical protein
MILVAHARNEGWGSLVQRVGHERPFFAVKHVHLYTHAVTNMVVRIPSDQTVAHVSFFNEKKIYTHGRNMLSGRGLRSRQTPVCIVSLPRLPTHVSRFYALESRSNGCAFKHLLVETMLLMFISFLCRHRRSHPGCAMLLLLNSYACTYMLLNLYNNIHLMLMVCLLKYPADSLSN